MLQSFVGLKRSNRDNNKLQAFDQVEAPKKVVQKAGLMMLKADHTAKGGKRKNQTINGGSGHLTIMFRCDSGEMQ